MSPTNRCTSIVGNDARPRPRGHAAAIVRPGQCSTGLAEIGVRTWAGLPRLANALSALYQKDSNEKRLLDAVLLAVPR